MPDAPFQLPVLVARRMDFTPERVRYVARPGLSALPSGTLTMVLAGFAVTIVVILLRRNPGFALGLLRAPFIRLTVTDRRVIWKLPWAAAPLLEISRERVVGGILGIVDRRGRGNAAMMLVPGDPAADVDGNIHFDRLPNVAGFVAAPR